MEPTSTQPGSRHAGAASPRRRHVLPVLAAVLLASVAGASAATPDPSAHEGASPGPSVATVTGADGCEALGLTIVMGGASLTPAAEAATSGIGIDTTGAPVPAGSIVFVVSLLDGPMPPLREQLASIEGMPHGPAAILLVGTEDVQDPELAALLLLETRELLAGHGQPDADTMPAFLDDDPNLGLLLRGLAVSR